MHILFTLVLGLTASSSGHAGWFTDWCSKHLVMDDPYEYEEVSDEWLAARLELLEVRERTHPLSAADRSHRDRIQREVNTRARMARIIEEHRVSDLAAARADAKDRSPQE